MCHESVIRCLVVSELITFSLQTNRSRARREAISNGSALLVLLGVLSPFLSSHEAQTSRWPGLIAPCFRTTASKSRMFSASYCLLFTFIILRWVDNQGDFRLSIHPLRFVCPYLQSTQGTHHSLPHTHFGEILSLHST